MVVSSVDREKLAPRNRKFNAAYAVSVTVPKAACNRLLRLLFSGASEIYVIRLRVAADGGETLYYRQDESRNGNGIEQLSAESL